MPRDPNCGRNMRPHIRRFLWDLNPWNLIRPWKKNPYYFNSDFPHKTRSALADLLPGHALTNLFVEFCRHCPYRAGHWWLWQTIVTVAGIVGVMIWLLKVT